MAQLSPGACPPGGARVYYIFQDALDPPLREQLMTLLSNDERERHGRFRFERDRDLYVLAHGMLRRVLATHAGVTPAELVFRIEEHGRPELAAPEAALSLRFNLTHTDGLVACAVAEGRAVGVDAEWVTRQANIRSLSARVFSDVERRAIAERSGQSAADRFFEHWTLKEAYVKAVGKGLSLPLQKITTTPVGEGAAELQLVDVDDDAGRWLLRLQRVGSAHQLAVVVEADPLAQVTFEELSLAL